MKGGGDPECLPGAYQQSDNEHQQDSQPHIQVPVHHYSADSAYKADHRAYRQVDIASGEDAHQHTCRQYENVGVLGNNISDVLRHQYLAVGSPGKKSRYQHQGNDHRIFLNKIQYFCL